MMARKTRRPSAVITTAVLRTSTKPSALKERSPSVKGLSLDMESLAVSKANTTVEDVPVRMVVMGEAYLERKETGGSQRFVCLIGEKGKVLLTFFTAQ